MTSTDLLLEHFLDSLLLLKDLHMEQALSFTALYLTCEVILILLLLMLGSYIHRHQSSSLHLYLGPLNIF